MSEQNNVPTVTIKLTPAQVSAVRMLSLKYVDCSIEQMADKLVSQVIRNYFATEAKAIAERSAKQYDAAIAIGAEMKISRADFIKRSVVKANEVLRELRGANGLDGIVA